MAGASGGTPAAAVPHAGGLGLAGSGHRDPSWLERELRTVAGPTSHAAGFGLITWAARKDIVWLVRSHQPAAVFLSFGIPPGSPG
jgi:nitronate monooxygenase